ncbi:3-ketoacyl-ACP reductase [Halalkalibacillus sediminis]|uniref:3-ketoacyl-ACP reductase n=1 Tax=Halalkalibacillus sediminis TaxID=2018042 RepID=A0A2I0QY73_9BACI|nr:SDR family oxidoreductase [Halalkalibacillus sediminis]PKR79284.1 3-ketoacyl-ACP reductase [Halalkalibacillus sediminis]
MRHVVITAGTKGLGKKMTDYFLEHGYSVTATYFSDLAKADQLLEENPNDTDRIHIEQLDVLDPTQIERVISRAYQKFGRIDCLVNNAGPYIFERKKLHDYSDSEWNEMIRGNLDASFHILKNVLPIMRKQQFGRLVFLGFQGANHSSGWIYRSAFAAAKVGLSSLLKSVALEEAENRITANMVAPGNISGEMKEANIEESRKKNSTETPIGRPGTGEDIARTVGYLCKDDSDMITGSVIEVTGGLDVIHRHL